MCTYILKWLAVPYSVQRHDDDDNDADAYVYVHVFGPDYSVSTVGLRCCVWQFIISTRSLYGAKLVPVSDLILTS